jgi:hypothetical protein
MDPDQLICVTIILQLPIQLIPGSFYINKCVQIPKMLLLSLAHVYKKTCWNKWNAFLVAGIITKDDLEKYTAAVKDALSVDLSGGDYRVLSPPPPSSGAVILLILNILDGNVQ